MASGLSNVLFACGLLKIEHEALGMRANNVIGFANCYARDAGNNFFPGDEDL